MDNNFENPADSTQYAEMGKAIKKETPSNSSNDASDIILSGIASKKPLMPSIDLNDYRRYTSSDAFSKLGINPNISQEEMEKRYDAAQSYGEAVGNAFGKFWNKTSNSFSDFFRADLDTVTNLPSNIKDTINLFKGDKLTNSSLMDHMYQEMKDEEKYDIYHPNFDSRDNENKNSLLQWIPGFKGSGDNYEQFLPSLGYTVGMAGAAAVQEGLVTLVTGGLGDVAEAEYSAYKGKKIYDLLNTFKANNIKNAWTALNTFNEGNKLVKGLKIGLEGLNMYSAFKSEAAMEAANTGAQTFDAINKEYIEKNGYALAGKEKEEAQQQALRAANTDYLLNAPILLTSNFIQFSKLFMPVGARVLEDLSKDAFTGYNLTGKLGTAVFEKEASIAAKLTEATTIPSKLKLGLQVGLNLIKHNKGTLAEGMEESLQRFASDYSQDYFTKQFKDKKDWNVESMAKSIGYSLADITSKAGLQEFIGGAVLGSLTHLVGKVADKTGVSDKWATLTGGETASQKEQRNEIFRGNVLDLVNNSSIDFALKDEGFANLVKESLNSKELIDYNKKQDLFNAANAKYLGLYNMVWNAVNSGKTDFIISQLKDLSNSTDKTELANKLGINPEDINHENLQSLVGSIVDKIQSTEKNFKTVQKEYSKLGIEKELVRNHNESVKELFQKVRNISDKYILDIGPDLNLEPHWDKLSKEDKKDLTKVASEVEDNKIKIYAYREAVKVASINFQSLEDTSKRSSVLLNELNNNKAGLNYTESLQLLEKKNLRELRRKAKTSLELATEPSDKKIYQKQLDAIEKADKATNHEEMADAIHEYAKASTDIINDYLHIGNYEIKSNYKNKLIDISKLQKEQRANLDIYNFLATANNFKEYREHTYSLFQDFFNKVRDWKEQLNKQEIAQPEETTVTPEPVFNKQTNVELTSNQQEQFNKLIEKFPNLDINISRDENGKHELEINYKSDLFGKLPEDKVTEIKEVFKEFLNDLDQNYIKELKKAEDTNLLKIIIDKYNNILDNIDPSKITFDDIAKLWDDFIKEGEGKSAPTLKTETRDLNNKFERILQNFVNTYNVEDEDFIPESQVMNDLTPEDKKIVHDIVNKSAPFKTMLKTSSSESVDIPNTNLEKLKENPYDNFIREFKDFLPTIQSSFWSVDIPEEEAEFRLVIRKDSKELQEKYQTSNSSILGEVIVVQTKDNGIWKDAYFDKTNFTHSLTKTDNNYLVVFSFTKPKTGGFNTQQAIDIRVNKEVDLLRSDVFSSVEQKKAVLIQRANEFFLNEQDKIKQLRQLAQSEDQPVLLTDISNGILLNSSKKTTASEIVKMEMNPVITIAAQKNTTTTILGNKYVLNGSAHVKVGDNYIQLLPKELSPEIIKEIDDLMEHTYEHTLGEEISDEITNVIKYLSTLVYTKPGLRQFIFNANSKKIELQKSVSQEVNGQILDLFTTYNKVSDFIKDEPLILNISKNRLNLNYTYTIQDNKLKYSEPTQEEYVKFILDNSDVRGDFKTKNGIPSEIKVSKYLNFTQAIESTPNTSVTNNSVSSDDLQAKKADIERRKNEELALIPITANKQELSTFVSGFKSTFDKFSDKMGFDKKDKTSRGKINEVFRKYGYGTSDEINEVEANKVYKDYVKKIHPDKYQDENLKNIANEFITQLNQAKDESNVTALHNIYRLFIEAKYDAELKALEGGKPAETSTDIKRRRQEELDNLGQKQIKNNFERLEEDRNKSPKAQLTIINSIEGAQKHGVKLTKEQQDKVNSIKEELRKQGYEIVDLQNTVLHNGQNTINEVVRLADENEVLNTEQTKALEKELESRNKTAEKLRKRGVSEENIQKELEHQKDTPINLIERVIEPQIMKDGKMTQAASVATVLVEDKNAQALLDRSKLANKGNHANKINAKYDAEYVDKVKKGEFTAQQAKDALKEINRLTPELSKQIDDAELAASENKESKVNKEVKPETPKTTNDLAKGGFITNLDDIFGPMNSSKETEEKLIDFTYERLDPKETEWIKTLAGRAGLEVLFKAANSDYWGEFTTAAITLFDAKKGTGYHEGWHTFSQMFLTKEQKNKLYNEVKNKVKELKDATPVQIEEYLAEDFKKYVLSDGKLILNKTPERKNIFQKIWNFIKNLFTRDLDLEKLYKDLRHGDLYEYKPSISNAYWGNLNSAKGFENIPIDRLIAFSKHADCVIGQILSNPLTEVSGKYQGNTITRLRSATEALKEPLIKNLVKNELLIKLQQLNGTKRFNEDLNQIINNFNDFLEFNSKYSKSGFELSEESEEPKIDEENLTRDTVYDKLANETSSFDLGKEATKELFTLVPKCKWNGTSYEVVYDKNGLMTSADQKVLWTLIASEFQNSLLEEDTLSKLNDSKLQKKIPELGYIADKLIPKGDNLNQQQKNVISSFHQSFSKVYVPIVTIVFKINDKGELEVFERYETKNNKAAIQQNALVNFFKMSSKTNFVKNGVVAQINDRNTLTDKFLSEKFDFTKNQEKVRFLNLLGFDVTLSQLNKEPSFQNIGQTLDLIDTSLKQRIEKGQIITNPIADVSLKFSNEIPSEKTNVSKVLDMISNVSLKNPSMSYRGANGQMKYGLQQYNKITQTNYWLSETSSYESMFSTNRNGYNLNYLNGDKYHLTRGSLFMELSFGKTTLSKNKEHQRLTDFSGNPIKIQIESYDGLELQDATSKPSSQKSTSDLNYREKLILDFNSLLINGRISMIQPASKRTYYSMKLSSYNRFSNISEPNYISLDSVLNSENPYNISKFINVYKNYLEAELFKIANKDYAKLKQDNFTLFDTVLSEKLQATLKKEAKASKKDNYFDIIEKHSSDIITEMTSYFSKIENELANEFAKYSFSTNDLASSLREKSDNINKFIQAYVINTYILGVEELKLFHGDTSFYNKQKGEQIVSSFFKRAGQNISTGAIPNVSNSFLNYQFNTQNFSLASVFGKTKAIEDFAQAKFQTIADQVVTNHPMLKETTVPGTKISAPKLIADVANSYKILQEGITGKPIEITQELINKLSKSFLQGNYDKINVTDGGGLCTLDFYRQVRDSIDNWSTEDENLYRALSIENKLDKSNNLTEEEKANLTKQMENYFKLAGDTVFDIAKLQANLIIIINGVPTPILHKFSLAPIFPSSAKGKQLEDIHDSMLKNGIDYLPFESSSKAFTPNIYELITNGNLSLNESKPTSLPLAGLKEQITTSSKQKKEKTRGVQITQLTLSNLMQDGKPIDFPGTKEEFQKLPYNELTPLGKIYRDNLSNLKRLKQINRESLYKELGLELQKNGDIVITNSEKLVKKLHQLADERQANSNIKTYVSFDKETKDFSNPLEFALNRDEIKKLINGLLDRKLRVMKANGSQAIQMSDFGQQEKNHDFTNPNQEDLLKYGVNGLPFTHLDNKGNLIKMGCKITMTDNYKILLNIKEVKDLAETNNISTLNALNQLLKTPEFRKKYEESLSIVGYRIPTDGPSSMMLLDIYEFLPTYEGNKIILPAGVTTQSGTDYDIDKLSLFFKYLNHEGKVISSNFDKKNIFKSLKDLKEKSDELLFNLNQIQKSQDFDKEQIDISSSFLNEHVKLWENLIEQPKVDEEFLTKLENFIEHHKNTLERYTQNVLGNSNLAKEYIKEFEIINQTIVGLRNQLDEKKQIENQIVKNYEETLSHPAMLYSMLKPNTVASLEYLSKIIGKKTGIEMTNFKNSEIINPLSSQKTHDELQEGKKALGIWAVGNTFFQNIAQTGLKLTGKLQVKIKENIKVYNTPNLLLSKAEELKYLDENGNFDISRITDAEGNLTKEIFSEAMNMCVDVEGNPFIKQLGHNLWNAPVALYMTIKKIPIERQWNFLNQPVLQHYYSELNKRGIAEKKSIIADIFNNYFAKSLEKYLGEEGQISFDGAVSYAQQWNSGNTNKFDLFELEDDISKKPLGLLEANKNTTNNIIKRQLNVFTHFIALSEEARELNKLRRNTNFPSRKIQGIIQANEYILNKKALLEDVGKMPRNPFFELSSLKDYYNNSIANTYNEIPIFKAISERMFPINSDSSIYSALSYVKPNKSTDDLFLAKAEKIMTNDVISSLYQNFGLEQKELNKGNVVLLLNHPKSYTISKIEGDNVHVKEIKPEENQVAKELVVPKSDIISLNRNTLHDKVISSIDFAKGYEQLILAKLKKLREENPELEENYPIVGRFLPNISKKSSLWNVELFRADANETSDKDSYIQQLKDLCNHENQEVAQLFRDIMFTGLYQSGYNLSPLFFTDIMNYDVILPIIHNANKMYSLLKEKDPDLYRYFVHAMADNIKYNNPSLYIIKKDEIYNYESSRGRNLTVDFNRLAEMLSGVVQEDLHPTVSEDENLFDEVAFNKDEDNSYQYQDDFTPSYEPKTLDDVLQDIVKDLDMSKEEAKNIILENIANKNSVSIQGALNSINDVFIESKDDPASVNTFIDLLKSCYLIKKLV